MNTGIVVRAVEVRLMGEDEEGAMVSVVRSFSINEWRLYRGDILAVVDDMILEVEVGKNYGK